TIADVLLDPGSSLLATGSVTLIAFHAGVGSTATAFSDAQSTFGSPTAVATNTQQTKSLIDANAGAHITARSLNVQAVTNPGTLNIHATPNAAGSTVPKEAPTRQITWNANVVILGAPDPELAIDAGGNVVKQTGGVTFTTTATDIVV